MYKLSTRFLVVILTFVIGIFAVSGWFYYQESQPIQIILPNSSWEPIAFGRAKHKAGINQATEMAGIKELRKMVLPEGDVEIRI